MRIPIKVKIASILFVCTFVLTLGIVLLQQQLNYRDLSEHYLSDARAAVTLAVDEADAWFQQNLTAVNLLGLEMERRVSVSPELERDLKDVAKDLNIPNARIGIQDGRFASTQPIASGHFKSADWFAQAKNAKTSFFIGPYRQGSDYRVAFAAPVFDEHRLLFRGAVAFDRSLEDLKSSLQRVFLNQIRSLQIIERKDKKFVVLVRTEGLSDAAVRAADERINEDDFLNTENTELAGEKILAVCKSIEGTPIRVYYPISVTSLTAPIMERAIIVGLLGGAGLIVIFLFSMALVGRHIRRIQTLNRSTQAVAAGDFKVRVHKQGHDEIGDLATSFNRMTESLIRYMEELKESVASKERLKRELELAAEIQQKALPEKTPVVDSAQIAAKTIPAYEVGGDYYDFLVMGTGEVGIVIADAAGKGLSGTLFMSNSRSVFRVIADEETRPGSILAKMNDFIAGNSTNSGMFITVLYSIYNPKTRKLSCVNAGHHPALIYTPGDKKCRSLKEAGLPIGIMPAEHYETETVQLKKDDIVVFFTDGLIEAINEKGEMFGHERVDAAIVRHASLSAAGMLAEIESTWRNFCKTDQLFDDMTLVVMKIV